MYEILQYILGSKLVHRKSYYNLVLYRRYWYDSFPWDFRSFSQYMQTRVVPILRTNWGRLYFILCNNDHPEHIYFNKDWCRLLCRPLVFLSSCLLKWSLCRIYKCTLIFHEKNTHFLWWITSCSTETVTELICLFLFGMQIM